MALEAEGEVALWTSGWWVIEFLFTFAFISEFLLRMWVRET
jgi:hypothetical protein